MKRLLKWFQERFAPAQTFFYVPAPGHPHFAPIQPKTIEEANARWRTSLAGRVWTTARWTYSPIEAEAVFHPDHTGCFAIVRLLGGDERTYFEWQENGDFSVRLRITSVEGREAEEGEEEADEEKADEEDGEPGLHSPSDYWRTFNYYFEEERREEETEIVLRGFELYTFLEPLR